MKKDAKLRKSATNSIQSVVIEALEDRRLLAFAHPGILSTQADFDRMAAKVSAGAQPWTNGYNALTSDGYSQLGWTPRPTQTVIRGGTGQNFAGMVIDMQRAFQTAVRWKVSGNTAYAEQAITILNAWSSTMTTLTGNSDRFLASGLYGFGWAASAEIMRTYSGWAPANVTAFQNYLLNIYYPMQHDFLTNHNGAYITNYWANWDLANIEGMMAIGIFADRQDIYDEAINYLYTGGGNGALDKMAYYLHPGNMWQWQESGRDQGHTTLGMALFGHVAQMAWNQGLDLFSHNNYQFLGAAEYIAKYNLGNDVPFTPYYWGNGQSGAFSSQTVVSNSGRGHGRVAYELIRSHYVDRLGMDAKYSELRTASIGVEWRGGGDEFGFGTLLYTLDQSSAPQAPRGVTALEKSRGNIQIDWFGGNNDASYNIYRSTSLNGTYSLIASGISDLLTYTDRGLPAGTYFYKITGMSGATETAASNIASATSTTIVQTQLPFNENSGTTATDSSGNLHNAVLNNGATWGTGKTGSAVQLDGVNDYVSLPANLVTDLSDFSISAWVNLNSAATWSRIFDFGDNRGRWMFLTPRNGGGVVEFATSTTYGYNKQWLTGTAAIPTNQWVHVAVTMSDRVGRLYINGVLVGSNPNMTFPPFEIGDTTNNWLGRSQFADPYLNGKIDDFQITRGAMTSGEVYSLATGQSAPTVPAAPATLSATAVINRQINLNWSVVSGATAGYTVWRSTTAGGPYSPIVTQRTTNTYSDTNLTAGVTYYYVVTAANNGGDGAYSMPASATALPPLPAAPGNVVAKAISSSSIQITWDAAADAASYTLKRSTVAGGPFATVATGITALTYIDTSLLAGTTYFYVVTSVNASGSSAASSEVNATPTDLSVYLKLNEISGSTATDSSGNNYNASLVNSPVWSTGKLDGALQFDGTDDHLTLPSGIVNGLSTITISAWINPATVTTWQRIFDFGTGTTNYMFLSTSSGSGKLRFSIKTPASGTEQQINSSVNTPIGSWSHVAVVLNGSVGSLYLNGTLVGSNSAMTYNPTSLGNTNINYLGRSIWSSDPYYNGKIDEFRIYSRAFNATEIGQLFGYSIPNSIVGTNGSDTYLLRRSGSIVQLFLNSTGTGSPAYSGSLSLADSILISGIDGNDWLIVDYSAGDPIPAKGIYFDGGMNDDTITVKGIGLADQFTIHSANRITHNATELSAGSTESLVLAGGNFAIGSNLTGQNLQVSGSNTLASFSQLQELSSLSIDSGANVVSASSDPDNPAILIDLVTINNASLTVAPNSQLSGVSRFSNLSILGSGKLELHDNDLVIDFGSAANAYASMRNYVKSGLALLGGNGGGISSTEVDNQSRSGTMLAVVDNTQIGGAITSLSGFSDFGASSILIKYTWFGDSNLDGAVDSSDYALIDTGATSSGAVAGWVFGDYDYSDGIDDSDYALIDTGFLSQNQIL